MQPVLDVLSPFIHLNNELLFIHTLSCQQFSMDLITLAGEFPNKTDFRWKLLTGQNQQVLGKLLWKTLMPVQLLLQIPKKTISASLDKN